MMKKLIVLAFLTTVLTTAQAAIHVIKVWDGYYQFLSPAITIDLGDTVQWLPLDAPAMVHTITSTTIPNGAVAFDEVWQAPADTFFQYVPLVAGLYNYECTPHAISWGMVGTITVQDNSVSVDEMLDDKTIIYPNPTSDIIYINKNHIGLQFEIYNLEGKAVMNGKAKPLLDLTLLNTGVYILYFEGIKNKGVRILKE